MYVEHCACAVQCAYYYRLQILEEMFVLYLTKILLELCIELYIFSGQISDLRVADCRLKS